MKVKGYMVICLTDAGCSASFYDKYGDAKQCAQDCECEMNGYSEIYVRKPDNEGMMAYEFLEA